MVNPPLTATAAPVVLRPTFSPAVLTSPGTYTLQIHAQLETGDGGAGDGATDIQGMSVPSIAPPAGPVLTDADGNVGLTLSVPSSVTSLTAMVSAGGAASSATLSQ
jgi:hypothetical protein